MNPALCASYKAEIPRGVHHEGDRYMIALYGEKCGLDEFTTSYAKSGEVQGPGYMSGGKQLMGMRVEEDGSAAIITFDDITWPSVTLRDVCCGLIYNASKQNRAVGVVVLAEKTSATNGPFTIYFPEANASDGVFVID
jgi:hypothetical protein